MGWRVDASDGWVGRSSRISQHEPIRGQGSSGYRKRLWIAHERQLDAWQLDGPGMLQSCREWQRLHCSAF